MVVLINAYSGVLTSLLTVPKLQPIAKTLEEVAEKNVLRLTIEKNTYFSEMFLVKETQIDQFNLINNFL